MCRALAILLALAALAGCGDASDPSPSEPARATTSTADKTPATKADGDESPFVVVTSLLGKPLRKEPGCRFAKTFIPNNPAATYDGGLALTVTCKKSDGYTPLGQIVNRSGSKPTEIMCRDTTGDELYCIYVPNSALGLYFTGTDQAVVRRRLQHLMETVASLPNGITPFSNAATP